MGVYSINADPFAPVDKVSLLEDKLQMSLQEGQLTCSSLCPSTYVTHMAGMQIFVDGTDSFGLYSCV